MQFSIIYYIEYAGRGFELKVWEVTLKLYNINDFSALIIP